MAKKKLVNMECPHCGEDLTNVGVVLHSRCHQTARVQANGAITDHDDLEIDAPDENQDVCCGECCESLGEYLNEDGLLVFPEPETPTVASEWGLRCPKCKDDSQIDITASVDVRITPDGTDCDASSDGSHEWEDGSAAFCAGCEYRGTVADFRIEKEKEVVNG